MLETFKYIIIFKPHNPASQGKLIFSCLQMRTEPGFELSFLDFKADVHFGLLCSHLHASTPPYSAFPS